MTPRNDRPVNTDEGGPLRGRKFSVGTAILATYICGHGGAGTVDHVTSLTEAPELAYELSNLRPAHGYHSPCPYCSAAAGSPVYCNECKGGYSLERARRKIEEKTGRPLFILDEDETPGERDW